MSLRCALARHVNPKSYQALCEKFPKLASGRVGNSMQSFKGA